MAEKPEDLLRRAYAVFNLRDIDGALALMQPDVEWPNGMAGGTLHGRDAVRAYWTRQWQTIDPRVEPLSIVRDRDGRFVVEVRQIVRSPEGAVISDRIVHHAWRLNDGKVASMEIIE